MKNKVTNDNVAKRQPEALAALEAAARNGGAKPKGQALNAASKTAPHRENPREKDAVATKILHRNAENDAHRRK